MSVRKHGWTDDGRKVITVAHPEHSSCELKNQSVKDRQTDGWMDMKTVYPAKNKVCCGIINLSKYLERQAWANSADQDQPCYNTDKIIGT